MHFLRVKKCITILYTLFFFLKKKKGNQPNLEKLCAF
jgi:hypothetical protein